MYNKKQGGRICVEIMQHYMEDILNLFQDYKIEKYTYEDKGYDFLDLENCFLTIKNPENSGDLSIKIGKEFTLFFGGWHYEYTLDEEGYRKLIDDIRNIINCVKCVYSLRLENITHYALGGVMLEDSNDRKTPRNLLNGINEFKKIRTKGSKLRLIAWQTEYNKEFVF